MSLATRVIPCLDVDDGRVVKGVRFEDLRDAGDPVEAATRYGRTGADEVVFLDISASREGRSTMLDVVEATADRLFIPLTVGGGVASVDDVGETLRAGADKVAINTAAVEDPSLVEDASERFGAQCVVVAIDAKRTDDGWQVHTHGGAKPRDLEAVAWAEEVADRGAGEILLTSMDMDGTRDGYDLELTRQVSTRVDVPVIASGGCGTVAHMVAAVDEGRADAVLAASIFHYDRVEPSEVKEQMADAGIEVRR